MMIEIRTQAELIFNLSSTPSKKVLASDISSNKSLGERTTPLPISERASFH